ncbi:hypothetical protein E2C01_013437 [Portunus trituberculatus]|uniref:Uncharacterized protein n=1 Tax=Portunus trituberculatus TaxID=210409 RepID=A0A5B7DGM6_PORTR|nr:hypothetical protein [Portunus trituberculatus]
MRAQAHSRSSYKGDPRDLPLDPHSQQQNDRPAAPVVPWQSAEPGLSPPPPLLLLLLSPLLPLLLLLLQALWLFWGSGSSGRVPHLPRPSPPTPLPPGHRLLRGKVPPLARPLPGSATPLSLTFWDDSHPPPSRPVDTPPSPSPTECPLPPEELCRGLCGGSSTTLERHSCIRITKLNHFPSSMAMQQLSLFLNINDKSDQHA